MKTKRDGLSNRLTGNYQHKMADIICALSAEAERIIRKTVVHNFQNFCARFRDPQTSHTTV